MQPSDLSLPSPPDFRLEMALSLQHTRRILQAMKDTHGSSWNPRLLGLVCWAVEPEEVTLARRLPYVDRSVSNSEGSLDGAVSLTRFPVT